MFREGEGMPGISRHPRDFLPQAPRGADSSSCALRWGSFGGPEDPRPSTRRLLVGWEAGRASTVLPGLSQAARGPGWLLHTPGAAVRRPAEQGQARGGEDRKEGLHSSLK